jgi:hypothetical protein
MSGLDLNCQPVWKVLYEAALLEFNPKILPQRVDEAKAAINVHWATLQARGDPSEDIQLLDAILALNQVLRTRLPFGEFEAS